MWGLSKEKANSVQLLRNHLKYTQVHRLGKFLTGFDFIPIKTVASLQKNKIKSNSTNMSFSNINHIPYPSQAQNKCLNVYRVPPSFFFLDTPWGSRDPVG